MIQLFAGGLAPTGKAPSEPLPLESGGIQHGGSFEDLVTGRSVHGRLSVAASLVDDTGELSLSATVGNVLLPERPAARQISEWRFTSGGKEITLERCGFDDRSEYRVAVSGAATISRQLRWLGLVPLQPYELADWAEVPFDRLQTWAFGIRHLQCPRRLLPSPFRIPDDLRLFLGSDGLYTPRVLAADDELREAVRRWCRSALGTTIDVVAQGTYFDLVAGAATQDTNVSLAQSGRGLSQILPVAVMALTAQKVGQGVDIIEHPEAELHPAAHGHVAELLIENIVGPVRPLVVETHSEMLLLRIRRWVAEGKLPADNVLVYWIFAEPGSGSLLRKIRINDKGELSSWPAGVFIEDYDEILAIRRAARSNG